MTSRRRQKFIHRELLHNNVKPFNQWKYEGKNPSYFHKNIIDYDYKTRLYIFMSSGRYREHFPIKVRHRGWPIRSPMTPQAWTLMELLVELQRTSYSHSSLPEEIYEGLYFISTGILNSEVEVLWDELLANIYPYSESNAELWGALFYSMIIGIQNGYPECEIIKPNSHTIKEFIRIFLNQERKINLLKEYYYNPNESFDTLIKWIYRHGPMPQLISNFCSFEIPSLEHRHSLTPSPV